MAQNFAEGRKNPKIRGWILRILDKAYPAGMEMDQVESQLNALGFDVNGSDIKRAVAYLDEKGCVEVDKKAVYGIERTQITNTTKATDVLEGTLDEPLGIDV